MTDLTLNLVWMLQGPMNTLAALSSGEWLMKPSSLERGMLQSKALSKCTTENDYKKHICYVVILTRVIAAVFDLISDHLSQSFCGGAGPARQSSGHICKKKDGNTLNRNLKYNDCYY